MKQSAITFTETPAVGPSIWKLRLIWRMAGPYTLALGLWAFLCAVVVVRNWFASNDFLPVTGVSMLAVAGAAIFCGARPAALVLALSAIVVALVPPFPQPPVDLTVLPPANVRFTSSLLFFASGLAIIWITDKSRRIQDKADQRRAVVGALRHMIVPERLPAVAGCEIAGLFEPGCEDDEVGGDFYDLFPLDGDHTFGILIGDVMGQGKEAAEHTALLRYSIRALAAAPQAGPAEVLRRVNGIVESQRVGFGLATIFYGVLDTNSGVMRYASAGHEPLLLQRAFGECELLRSTGLPIGADTRMEYNERSTRLLAGDSLLLLTDGAPETRNESGGFLGSDGVAKLLHQVQWAESAEAAVEAIRDRLRSYAGQKPRHDDLTLLLIRRKGSVDSASIVSAASEAETVCH